MKERDLVYKGKRLICLRVLCVAALCCTVYVDASFALLNSEQESGSDEYSVSQQQELDSKESENPSSQSEGPESITPVESATGHAQNIIEQEKAVLSNTAHSERAKYNVEESLLNTIFLVAPIVIASLLAWIVILLLRARRRNSQSVAMAISKGDVSGEPDKADKSTTKQRDQARYTADDLQHIIEILKPELVSSVLEAANSKEPEENLQLQQERQKCKRVSNQLEEKSKECEELKLINEHITRQLNEAKVKCSDAENEKRIQALKNADSSKQFKNLLLKITHNLSLETSENQFPDLPPLQINSDDAERLESFFDKGLKTQTDLSDQLEAKKNELSKTTDELKHLKQMIAGFYTSLVKEKPAENDDPESLLATVTSEFRVVTMELNSMREETAAIRNNVHTKVGNGLNESFIRCRDDLLTELHQTDLLPTKVKANLTNALQELRTDHELSNSDHLRYWKAALNQAAKYVFHNPFLQSMETLGSRFLHFFYLAASIAEAKGLHISVPIETDATITASSIEYSEFRKPVVYYDFDEIKQEYFKEQIVKQTAVNMLLLRNMRVAPELLVEITDITDWRSLDAFVSKFSDESVSFITKINQIGFMYTDGDREATNASVEKI